MPRVVVQALGQQATNRRLAGRWWSPLEPERVVGGTLEFTPGDGGRLELHGGLLTETEPPWPTSLLGEVDSKRVTLSAAYRTFQKMRGLGGDAEVVEQVWSCQDILVGLHEPTPKATFEYFVLETAQLARWIRQPLAEMDYEGGARTIKLATPDSFNVELGDKHGRISLQWGETTAHDALGGVTLQVEPRFVWHPPSGRTLDQAWQDFVVPMLFFVSLVTDSSDRVSSLHVGTNDPNSLELRNAEWLATRWTDQLPSSQYTHHWEHPITFPDLVDDFSRHLASWIDLAHATSNSLLDFFSVAFTPGLYLEETLLRVIRAMESWHRGRHGGNVMAATQFKDLLKRSSAGLDKDERKFLRERLARANDLTLRTRLEWFRASTYSFLGVLIPDATLTKIVRTRDSLAHEGTIGKHLSDEEVVWAAKTLELIFRTQLLREIGIQEETLQTRLQRTRSWRLVTSDQNALFRLAGSK